MFNTVTVSLVRNVDGERMRGAVWSVGEGCCHLANG